MFINPNLALINKCRFMLGFHPVIEVLEATSNEENSYGASRLVFYQLDMVPGLLFLEFQWSGWIALALFLTLESSENLYIDCLVLIIVCTELGFYVDWGLAVFEMLENVLINVSMAWQLVPFFNFSNIAYLSLIN